MKHLKHMLALCLCFLLVFEVGAPMMPKLGELTGLWASAGPAAQTWSDETDTFDLGEEMHVLKDDQKGEADIQWVRVGDKFEKDPELMAPVFYRPWGATPWKTNNFSKNDKQAQYINVFESTKPEDMYIRLTGNIGSTYGDSKNDKTDYVGGGKRWDRSCVISSSKVIDLNGYSMGFLSESKDQDLTMFYITGKDTTVIIYNSCPDLGGMVWFRGKYHNTDTKYQEDQVRNLFQVDNGATLYLLNGTYAAGGMQLEDIETGWMKFKRIFCSILDTALTVTSAAMSIYASFTGGGGGAAANASNALDKLSDKMGMGSAATADVNTDAKKDGAKTPEVKDPKNGKKNLEADTEDTDGKNAEATKGGKGNNDTNGKAGSGASVLVNTKGVWVVTNKDGADAYSGVGGSNIKLSPYHPEGKTTFNYGDEISVIDYAPNTDNKWVRFKYGSSEAYMEVANSKTGKPYIEKAYGLAPLDDLPADRISLRDSMLDETEEALNEYETKEGIAKLKTVVSAVKNKDVEKAADAIVSTYGEITANKGKFYQVHMGNIARTLSGGRVVIFDGTYTTAGMNADEHNKMFDIQHGSLYICGGTFLGLAGSDIIQKGTNAQVTIRGGTFDCSSVNVIRAVQKTKKKDKEDEYDYAVGKIPGVRGTVNASIECFGEDMIKDGRIQIYESAGAGNLVLKNTDPYQDNKIVYSLYCAEKDLPNLSSFTVTPQASEYISNSFKLVGSAEYDGVLDGRNYIYHVCDIDSDYLVPHIGATTAEAAIGSITNKDALISAMYSSGMMYYNFPQTEFFKNTRFDYTGYEYSYANADEWAAGMNWYLERSYNSRLYAHLPVYEYTVYEVDPVTMENVGKPLVTKAVSSASILTGQIYLTPPKDGKPVKDRYYLMQADEWIPGKIYRVKLTLTEYADLGRNYTWRDTEWLDKKGKSVKVDPTGLTEFNYKINDENKAVSSTSVVIRCCEDDKEEFTALRFADESVGVGDTAEVNFLNAQVGRIDIYGQKLFSVRYDWKIKDHPDEEDTDDKGIPTKDLYKDLHLVTTTRNVRQGQSKTYTIPGHVCDDMGLVYGQTVNKAGQEPEFEGKTGTDFLGDVVDSVADSVLPYYSADDSFTIPETVEFNGKTIDLAGKYLYCEVTYGLCYARWSRAFKYLPICDYAAQQGYSLAPEVTAGTVRETMEQKTYKTKAIQIKPGGQSVDSKDNRSGNPKVQKFYAGNAITVPFTSPLQTKMLADAKVIGTVGDELLTAINNGEYYQSNLNDAKLDEVKAKALKASEGGNAVPVISAEIHWQYYDETKKEYRDISERADAKYFDLTDSVLTGYGLEDSVKISCYAVEKGWIYYNGKEYDATYDYSIKDTVYQFDYMGRALAAINGSVITDLDQSHNGDLEKDGWTFVPETNTLILKDFHGDQTLDPASLILDSVQDLASDKTIAAVMAEDEIAAVKAIEDNEKLITESNKSVMSHSYVYQNADAESETSAGAAMWFADDVTIELQGKNQIIYTPVFKEAASIGRVVTRKGRVIGDVKSTYLRNISDLLTKTTRRQLMTEYNGTQYEYVRTNNWSGIHAENITFTGSGSLSLVLAAMPGSGSEKTKRVKTASLLSASSVHFRLSENGSVDLRSAETGNRLLSSEIKSAINKSVSFYTGSILPKDVAFIRTDAVDFRSGAVSFQGAPLSVEIKALEKTDGSEPAITLPETKEGVLNALTYEQFAYAASSATAAKEDVTVTEKKISELDEAKTALEALTYSTKLLTEKESLKVISGVDVTVDRFRIENHTHAYKLQEITKYPTATEKGEGKYVCECGDTKTAEIPVFTVTMDAPALTEENTVSLSWQGGATADSFDVYRAGSENGEYKKLASVTEAEYTDAAVTKGATYYYKVKAVRTEKEPLESAFSNVVSIKVTGESVMLGDVNGDGQIKALDARLALRAAVGLENYAPGSREFLAADVNKDGKILAKDARTILRGVVGLEDPKAW